MFDAGCLMFETGNVYLSLESEFMRWMFAYCLRSSQIPGNLAVQRGIAERVFEKCTLSAYFAVRPGFYHKGHRGSTKFTTD